MCTKRLVIAAILSFFWLLAYTNSEGNDSTYILVKVLNNSSRQNQMISYDEQGAYFTRFSNYSYKAKKPSMGPLYRIKSSIPVKFRIFGGGNGIIEGIALPGDTTTVEIDYSKPEIPVKFSGGSASICNFCNTSGKASRKFYPRAYSQNTSDTYIGYFNFLEGQYQSKDSFHNVYIKNQPLPEWFQSYYKSSLVYEKALLMIENIHTMNYSSRNKIYPNPEFLLWFRDVAIDNPKATNDPVYFDFLWQYFLWKSKITWNRAMGGKVSTDWVAAALPHIDRELKNHVKEWFLKELLVNYYAAMDVDDVDAAFSLSKPYLTSKQYLEEINLFREKAIEFRDKRFASAAKVGLRAPRFHLTDSLNITYSPDKFYGKWVYIRFFNTNSFSEESFKARLQKDSAFIHKVQLVNIYTNADKDSWKKVLSRYPGSGLHLFCKGNWGEMLKYQYGLRFLPYDVLIDPQGIIQYSGTPKEDDVFAIIK